MAHLCPWWGGYFIDNRLRRLLHDPERIVGPHVGPGMTVMDVGCGMGFFSIAMARMVGPQGRVLAVELQQKMLDVLRRRAEKAGLADRIEIHACPRDRLGVRCRADFVLAFAMVHEVPDQRALLGEIAQCLKPEGKLLVAEPRGHVPPAAFEKTLDAARAAGLVAAEEPRVRWCRAALFTPAANR